MIDLLRMLQRDFPRTINSERRCGMEVEIKDIEFYRSYNGYDPTAAIFKVLKDNNLHLIDTSKDDIPMVIQSFNAGALLDWTLRFSESDIPRIFCFGANGANVF